MQHRQQGMTQEIAAAKSAISTRTARRIEQSITLPRAKAGRDWRTREDPLEAVWENELVVLLNAKPELTPITLLEYLQEHYPNRYDQRVLRTLQRRVKQFKALHGPDKDVIFRQQAQPGLQGFSDFTHPDSPVTIKQQPFAHLLYQFRLAYSGWRSITVVQGGESYSALSTGLQRALTQAGGCPVEHRTDSLSAARNNTQNVWTDAYQDLCEHYNMTPTRNNLGQSHENGVVECANGSFKRRLAQHMLLRGHSDFDSIEAYQAFIDQIVGKLNQRSRSRFLEEQQALQALPEYGGVDYTLLSIKATRSSTIEVRRVVYSVPSRLIGERLQVRLYHDKLVLYVGQQVALTLPRVYPAPGQNRARCINYRHIIRSLAAKPQAFRYSQLRDDILPNDNYRQLWALADNALPAQEACKWIVTVLWLASEYDSEQELGETLLQEARAGLFESAKTIQERFYTPQSAPEVKTEQHNLQSYDELLTSLKAQTKHDVEVPF
jgi:hypothetical protein